MKSAPTLLPWIVAFKPLKAATLAALGFGLLFSARHDPVAVVWSIAGAVHLPISSRAFDRVLNLALQATPKKEVGLALTAFTYSHD